MKGSRKVALLGSHLPRQCGIATFTSDLSDALEAASTGIDCCVVAVSDIERRYTYQERVRFEISESELVSYCRAANFLNDSSVGVLSLQHEYGIYGGNAGAYVLELLRKLRMPIVTTLHTILAEPTIAQRLVMDELTQLSDRLVVMSQHGAELLRRVHQVPVNKIDVIPHGFDAIPLDGNSKDVLGLADHSIILTFGLLSPDKGIEYMIDALPAILARFPNTVYVVVGVTHPHVKVHDGEAYRLMLEDRAKRLGVESQVRFHNRFVSHDELRAFLSAADIYVTPYLKPEQSTSGTLAYALGSGKAVISTPYRYAQELLGEGRGILVPWRDSDAIATHVTELLGSDSYRHAMQRRATAYTSDMAWPCVARRYIQSYELAVEDFKHQPRRAPQERTFARRHMELLELGVNRPGLMNDG
jgi:glycosyltransferase involved in cell wall biosynthesis